jgi:anaerobic magnesium-protoporphyrin IX monomethyl ester cyclase
MRVLIINPPSVKGHDYIREGRCMQKKASWTAMWMPLTLAYIASVLRKENEIKLVDCQAEKINFIQLRIIITDFLPNLLICNTGFPTIKSDLFVLETAKNISKDIKTSIFGMYPTLLLENVFSDTKYLDFSIIGEPEWVYKDLVNSLNNNKEINDTAGLIYVDNFGNINQTKHQELNNNILDDLEFPSRDLLPNSKYLYPLDKKPFTLLTLSRGCPYNCTFCNAYQYSGHSYRKRSIVSIIKEIEECISKYKIRNFLFWGESFSLDINYANDILDAIIQSGLKISWSTRTMVDKVEDNLLMKMKLAGCKSISLGIESFNQDILNNVQKGTTIAEIKNAILSIKKAGIISIGHFVFGLPGDNVHYIKESIKFSLDSGLDYAQFYCAVPYPNTPYGKFAKAKNWIESEDYTKYHLDEAVTGNENLSANDIKKWRKKAYLKFYLRPSVIFKTLIRISNIKSLLIPFVFRKWI